MGARQTVQDHQEDLIGGIKSPPPPNEVFNRAQRRKEILGRINSEGAPGGEVRFVNEMAIRPHFIVEKYTLSNGLTLLAVQDNRAPVLAYQSWFNVGSADDAPGKRGMAHLFEHLMFRESVKLPAGTFDRILEWNGAMVNAATWLDWTQYQIELPTGRADMVPPVPPLLAGTSPENRLELVVLMESDRMMNILISNEQLDSERQVVRNEQRLRVEDDAEGKLSEVLYATAFTEHPYRWPVIGLMGDLDQISVEHCREFYEHYYQPANASLVVVGDFQMEELLTLVRRHYGPIPSQVVDRTERKAEPPFREAIRTEIHLPVSTERLLVGYRIPKLASPESAVLTVLNEVLFGGEAGRLHNKLVIQTEIASEATGWVGLFRNPALYEVTVDLREGHSAAEAEVILDKEMARLGSEGVNENELERAVNRLEAAFWRELATAEGKAGLLGHYQVTIDDYRHGFYLPELYQRVTNDDIKKAARSYLLPDNKVTVVGLPGEMH